MFSLNLSASCPVRGPIARRLSAEPNSFPYISCSSIPLFCAYCFTFLSRSARKFCRPPAALMDAALNDIPICSAILLASLEGFTSAVNTAASCVDTSAVLPLTPVSVENVAMSSSMLTPSVAALPVTLGSACASCSKDVTPFLAVSCILSCISPAASHERP